MVEGTPLLREHTGQNLYPGFESLRLRHLQLCTTMRRGLQVVPKTLVTTADQPINVASVNGVEVRKYGDQFLGCATRPACNGQDARFPVRDFARGVS